MQDSTFHSWIIHSTVDHKDIFQIDVGTVVHSTQFFMS